MLSAHAEQQRVAAHIQNAEAIAGLSDAGRLDSITQIVRQLLLEELAHYRAAGVFPQNKDFAEPTPYFVDAGGTRCAMAHLLEVGGERSLVAKISAERNNAYVKELADEPRLIAWLKAAGISVEEAAAIQPTYNDVRSSCVCGSGFGASSVVVPANVVLEATAAGETATVTAIHGGPAGHVVGETVALSFQQTGKVVVVEGRSRFVFDGGLATDVRLLNEQGQYVCSSMGVTDALPLTPAQLASAVTASSVEACQQTLVAIHPSWGQTRATLPGCSAGVGDPTSLGILVALLIARARR